MPGHKGYEFFARNGFGDAVKRLASWDITEICGADNLFQPESIIRRTMEKYQRLYDVKKSYLLINGSSAGIIAAILAAVPRGSPFMYFPGNIFNIAADSVIIGTGDYDDPGVRILVHALFYLFSGDFP